MPITINPITVPPEPGAVADTLWIRSLNISAPSPTKPIIAIAQLVPMVGSTGQLLQKEAKVLHIHDVYAAAATDPVLAQAVMAIFAGIQSQVQVQGLFAPPAPEPEPEPEPEP